MPTTKNPLPIFSWQQPSAPQAGPPVGLQADEVEGFTQMGQLSILPYRVQDSYSRTLKMVDHACIVYQNRHLRLKILPGLGGRIYSLYDRSAKRELLFCNPVIRAGNLALRNAWFSGGIEFNGGSIPGHAPSSCAPVFCHRVDTELGPVLRIYDFDRVSETPWQIDLFLPNDSARLFVHGKIVNPNEDARRVYWWTNVSVPFSDGQRIVSPADYAIEHAEPGNHLERFNFPDQWGFDGSYPKNWLRSTSVFFRKPDQNRPWVVSCTPDGHGFGQISNRFLKGRKYFYFGEGDGGSHWMEFLSGQESKGKYVEVQSGLMPTQNQLYQLHSGQSIEWTECFLPLENAEPASGGPYVGAVEHLQTLLDAALPETDFSLYDAFLARVSGQPVGEQLAAGEVWGDLHEKLLGASMAPGMSFIVDGQEADHNENPWHCLANGLHVHPDVRGADFGFVASDLWRQRLLQNMKEYGTSWFHQLHLGIIALNREEIGEAEACFRASLKAQNNWLAHRCLGVVLERQARFEEAMTAYEGACATQDAPPELFIEYASLLARSGNIEAQNDLFKKMPAAAKKNERVHILQARLALKRKDFSTLQGLLSYEFATIREGETVLSDLWWGLVEGRAEKSQRQKLNAAQIKEVRKAHPLPTKLNFVMLQVSPHIGPTMCRTKPGT